MPTIGDPSRFATQYEPDANSGREWMFGRFCYWCGGQRVGDFELGTSLRDVLFQLEDTVKCASPRLNTRIFRMRAPDAFRLLNAALYGLADLDNREAAELENWAKHNLLPPVDVFDLWKAFVVEDDGRSRIIFARDPYDDVHAIELQQGEVDQVIKTTCLALTNLHARATRAADAER